MGFLERLYQDTGAFCRKLGNVTEGKKKLGEVKFVHKSGNSGGEKLSETTTALNPFGTAAPFWGRPYLELEWFVPKTGLLQSFEGLILDACRAETCAVPYGQKPKAKK